MRLTPTHYNASFGRAARAVFAPLFVAVAAAPFVCSAFGCSSLTAPPEPQPVASDIPVAPASAPSAALSAPSSAKAAATPTTTQSAAPTIPAPDDVKAPPANAKKTASGLAYRVLTEGKGKDHPKAIDRVTVNYTGWTTDGKMFDSSVTRGQPATFPLNGVIKGWTEGVQLMTPGSKYRFWIPAAMAYGDNPGGGRPGGMLVFDVELMSIQPTTPPPGASGSAKPGSAKPK